MCSNQYSVCPHAGKTGHLGVATHTIQMGAKSSPSENEPTHDDDQEQDQDRDWNGPDRSVTKVFKSLGDAARIVREGGINDAFDDQTCSQCGDERIYMKFGDDQ